MKSSAAHPSKAGNTQLLKIVADESGPLRTAALETFVKSGTSDSVPNS